LTVINAVYFSYILNRGWVDKDSKKLPTYKDIVGPSKVKKKSKHTKDAETEASSASEDGEEVQEADDAEFDEDDFDEINEQFETSYNFRFEEPYVHFTLVNLTALTSFSGMAQI
jgi:protein KRI1